jgi:hypothetical protein
VDVHRHVGVLTRPAAGNPAVAGVVAALTAAAADRHDPGRGVCPEPVLPATPPRVRPVPGRSR